MDRILVGFLLSVAAFVALSFLLAASFSLWKLYSLLSKIQKNLESIYDNGEITKVTLEGISKLCADLISSAGKMSGSVEKFQKNIFSQTSGSRRESFQPYSDESADNAWKVMELARSEGISETEAAERLESGLDMGRFVVHE